MLVSVYLYYKVVLATMPEAVGAAERGMPSLPDGFRQASPLFDPTPPARVVATDAGRRRT